MGRHGHAPGKERAPTQQALNEDTLWGGDTERVRCFKQRLENQAGEGISLKVS